MNDKGIESIFEQIDMLKKPNSNQEQVINDNNDTLDDVLKSISIEIQRVLDENNLTQEDLCEMTGMSQSNISKILNGKIAPRINTLHKIATTTNTRLVVSFENVEED